MSAKEQFDPDALATLTDEERAAITSDDMTDEERAALAAVAAGGGDDEEDDDEGDEGAAGGPIEGQGADGTPTATKAGEADQGAPPGGADADDVPAGAAPEGGNQGFKVPDTAAAQERLIAIKDERKALAAQFRSGEIDLDEFQERSDALADELADLSMQRASGAAIEEINRQTAEQRWNTALGNLVRTARLPEGGGVDYEKDQEKAQDLDQFIKVLAAKPENGKHGFEWFLAEAHKRVLSLHGLTAAPPRKDPPPTRDPQKPQPSLATVPGGDGPGDVSDSAEFAHLDNLEGLAFEEALARLTPAQRARYAAAA